MPTRDLNVVLRLNTATFQRGLNRAVRDLDRFGKRVESIGRDLTTRLTLPLAGIGVAAVSAFADFEKLTKGLEAIATEADPASKQLERLRKLALEPGISLEQAVAGSIRLQAVGQSAADAERTLLQFSKAVALAGGTAEDLDVVTRQLSQIQSKGRILSEDFLVIAERVPAIGLALETAFGTKNIEDIRESGISASEFVKRLTDGIAGTEAFQKVTGGLANSFDNFRQSITASLVVLGDQINKTLNLQNIFNRLAEALNNAVTAFTNLSDGTKRFIVIAAAVAAAIGPILVAIGGLVRTIPLLVAGFRTIIGVFNPYVIAAAAVAAWFVYLYNTSDQFRGGVVGAIKVMQELLGIANSAVKLLPLLAAALANPLGATGAASIEAFKAAFFAIEGDLNTIGDRLGDAFTTGFRDGIVSRLDAKKSVDNIVGGIADGIAGATLPDVGIPGVSEGGGNSTRSFITPFQSALPVLNLIPDRINSITESNRLATQSLQELGATATIQAVQVQSFSDRFEESQQRIAEISDFVGDVLGQAFDSVFDSLANGGNIFKGLTDIIKKVVAQLIKAVAVAAALAAIFSLITGGTGGGFLTLFKGFLGGGGAGGNFLGKLVGFAEGGLVYGPQVALVGEGIGTTRANPEVIAPLDKLRGLIGETGQAFVAEARISGDDLLLLIERAERQRGR